MSEMTVGVDMSVFEKFCNRFPAGHTKDSSSFPISHALYSLVRLIQPSHVVEVGTFEGASSIWLARGLVENNRGSFTGYEINPDLATKTRENLHAAVPGGPHTVKTMNYLEEPYVETDFLFLDCAKELYPAALSKTLVPINGYVIAHDTVSWPLAAQFYRQMKCLDDFEVCNLHTEQGLMIARKVR